MRQIKVMVIPNKEDKVLFIAEDSRWSYLAADILEFFYENIDILFWSYGDASPELNLDEWYGDWILSFKSDLILSETVLVNANKGALNFHPAPPKYRGIGGYEYAVYNKDSRYGVTCHHMVKEVDYGSIISVDYFPIEKNDTVSTLKDRAGLQCVRQFIRVGRCIANNDLLPKSDERWGEKLFTRTKLRVFLAEHYTTKCPKPEAEKQ